MIVLGIETATPQSSLALGDGERILGALSLTAGRAQREAMIPGLEHLLRWTDIDIGRIGGVAVGIGPGLFTGLRVGVEVGKALSQALRVPIVGLASLDVLAFQVHQARRLIAAAIDARRGEVFYALYRPVPGGAARESGFLIGSPDHLAAELEARREEVLLVGNGAILYRKKFEQVGSRVEFASSAQAYPLASALVELAVPRFLREEHDRLFDVVPLYLRKSDAEIAWDRRARGA